MPFLRRAGSLVCLGIREHSLRWPVQYLRWRRRALTECPSASGPRDITAILLSYKRPQNIDVLVRVLLRTPSISHIIVSNNNPDVRMRDWVSIAEARVRFIDQPEHRHAHSRYALARDDSSSLFFCLDDDLFLTPSQIESLLGKLRSDGSAPHGIFGQVHDSWLGIMHLAIRGVQYRCACINRAYAFRRPHVEEFFRLCQVLGFTPESPMWNSSMWDDIVISFSGTKMPMLHDGGRMLDCPTSSDMSIAVFRQPGFLKFRQRLFYKLRTIKPLPAV